MSFVHILHYIKISPQAEPQSTHIEFSKMPALKPKDF